MEDLLDQLSVARYELAYFRSHWRNVVRGASQHRDEEVEGIQQESEHDLAEFDQKIESSETPVKFRKYSPELLQFRRRQMAMVASKRYIEAKVTKDEADRLQAKEDAANHARFREKAAADRAEMVKKQNEKLFVRQQTWNRTIYEIERIANAEIDQILKTIEHLDIRIREKEEFARAAGWAEPEPEQPPSRTSRDKTTQDGLSSYSHMFRQRRLVNKLTYSPIKIPKTVKSAR
jgi:hypothetical protein